MGEMFCFGKGNLQSGRRAFQIAFKQFFIDPRLQNEEKRNILVRCLNWIASILNGVVCNILMVCSVLEGFACSRDREKEGAQKIGALWTIG